LSKSHILWLAGGVNGVKMRSQLLYKTHLSPTGVPRPRYAYPTVIPKSSQSHPKVIPRLSNGYATVIAYVTYGSNTGRPRTRSDHGCLAQQAHAL